MDQEPGTIKRVNAGFLLGGAPQRGAMLGRSPLERFWHIARRWGAHWTRRVPLHTSTPMELRRKRRSLRRLLLWASGSGAKICCAP